MKRTLPPSPPAVPRLVAIIVLAVAPPLAGASDPIVWSIDELFLPDDQTRLWTSPTSVATGQMRYDYAYDISSVAITFGGSVVPEDVTSDFAGSLPLTASGQSPTLPLTLVDGTLEDPDTQTSIDLGLTINAQGFAQASFDEITLGNVLVDFGTREVPIDTLRLQAEITVTAIPPFDAGDYNGDGDIDADDYTLWSVTFGSTAVLAADGNLDGVVDAADYALWRDAAAASSSSVSVPEPAGVSAVLVLLTISACGVRFS